MHITNVRERETFIERLLGCFYMHEPYACILKEGIVIPILKMRRQRLKRDSATCIDVNWYLVQARFELESVWLYGDGFPLPISSTARALSSSSDSLHICLSLLLLFAFYM